MIHLLGKKLEVFSSIVMTTWYIVQAYGVIEDRRLARKADLKHDKKEEKDARVRELEAQIASLKAQIEAKKSAA
jgi:hypothetical protein